MYGLATDCERGGKFEGFSRCDVEVRVNPGDDIRLFGGAIRRDGPEWEMTYRQRWSVERVFSRWKEIAVLDNHSFSGLSMVRPLVLTMDPHGGLDARNAPPLVEAVGWDQAQPALERGLERRTFAQRLAAPRCGRRTCSTAPPERSARCPCRSRPTWLRPAGDVRL